MKVAAKNPRWKIRESDNRTNLLAPTAADGYSNISCHCLNVPMFEYSTINIQTLAVIHQQPIFEQALPKNMYDYMLPKNYLRKTILVGLIGGERGEG